jgi:hypothetical protein
LIPWTTFVVMPVVVVAWWFRWSARAFVGVVAGAGCFVES